MASDDLRHRRTLQQQQQPVERRKQHVTRHAEVAPRLSALVEAGVGAPPLAPEGAEVEEPVPRPPEGEEVSRLTGASAAPTGPITSA